MEPRGAQRRATKPNWTLRCPADAARVGPVALPEEVVYLLGLRALRLRTVPVTTALRAL